MKHVSEIRKNLVYGYLINKARLSGTIGADMYTLTKNGAFVGKGWERGMPLMKSLS